MNIGQYTDMQVASKHYNKIVHTPILLWQELTEFNNNKKLDITIIVIICIRIVCLS